MVPVSEEPHEGAASLAHESSAQSTHNSQSTGAAIVSRYEKLAQAALQTRSACAASPEQEPKTELAEKAKPNGDWIDPMKVRGIPNIPTYLNGKSVNVTDKMVTNEGIMYVDSQTGKLHLWNAFHQVTGRQAGTSCFSELVLEFGQFCSSGMINLLRVNGDPIMPRLDNVGKERVPIIVKSMYTLVSPIIFISDLADYLQVLQNDLVLDAEKRAEACSSETFASRMAILQWDEHISRAFRLYLRYYTSTPSSFIHNLQPMVCLDSSLLRSALDNRSDFGRKYNALKQLIGDRKLPDPCFMQEGCDAKALATDIQQAVLIWRSKKWVIEHPATEKIQNVSGPRVSALITPTGIGITATGKAKKDSSVDVLETKEDIFSLLKETDLLDFRKLRNRQIEKQSLEDKEGSSSDKDKDKEGSGINVAVCFPNEEVVQIRMPLKTPLYQVLRDSERKSSMRKMDGLLHEDEEVNLANTLSDYGISADVTLHAFTIRKQKQPVEPNTCQGYPSQDTGNKLLEEDECCICLERACSVVFTTCNHKAVCGVCAAQMVSESAAYRKTRNINGRRAICPLCRRIGTLRHLGKGN